MQNDITVSGTNSIGTMLANEIEAQNEENEGNDGYNVLSIEIEDNEAYVTFETATDAILLVAIYNEACDTLIATGTTEVTKDETEVSVTIDIEEMPQYFYVKGYLVDAESSKPFCVAYESPNYTQEMQEFFAKTTDDFEEDLVLNFDDSNDNNFAVYNENVTLIGESEETNNLVSADDTTKTYVFENINEEISGLQEGDIFSYDYSDGNALVVKISTITIDGTTATIVGTDTTLDEIFDYMKIDSTASESDYTYEDTDVTDGVTVEKSENNDENARAIVDADRSNSFSLSVGLNYSPNDVISISGSATASFNTKTKIYISLSYQYIEITLSNTVKFNAKFCVKGTVVDIKLGEVKVCPVLGLTISFEPAFVVEGELDLEVNLTLTSQSGFSLSSDNGFKNLSTMPKPDININFSCKFFIGLKLTIRVKIVGGVVECGASVKAGVEISLKYADTRDTSSQKHNCKLCEEGEIYGKIVLSAYAKIFQSDKMKLEGSVASTSKLGDIYYSVDHFEFGFGKCPHIEYKVTVVVKDSYGNFISGAYVNSLTRTDENGKADIYLPYGKNEIFVIDGENSVSKTLDMINQRTSVTVVMPSKEVNIDDSEYDVPTITGEVAQIAAGGNSSAVVTKDGELYTWGSNTYSQLGTYSNSDVKTICIGATHGALITKDGVLYTWGNNNYGQLGDGTTKNSTVPIKIMDNVVSVSLGGYYSAAITADGSLYTWGYNCHGQLGNGKISNSTVPVKIMDNVVSVSLGEWHSAAITKDGSLYTWGYNENGQLGNGKAGNYCSAPVKVMDNVVSVSLGGYHCAAIKKDGSLYMWGKNNYGQLGNGTTENKYTPEKVAKNIQSVNLGYNHTVAITKDGGLYTWGYNKYGELGNGTTVNSSVPVKIMNNVVESAVGYDHTLVLKKDGTMYTWGYNGYRQLGDGTTVNKTSPVLVDFNSRVPELINVCDLLEPVGASSTQRTVSFTGYKANSIYNFYSLKSKDADTLLTDDNILYVDQVRADSNGKITVTYTPKADCDSPYEFVASITQIDLSNAVVSDETLVYNGKMQTVAPTVKVNSTTLYEGIDYTITGEYEAKNVGEYTYTMIGKGDFVGNITKTFTIKAADINDCDASEISPISFTGNLIEPEVVLSMNNNILKKDVDYTVEYQNNENVGIGIVVIKGIGNYSGRKVCWFDITQCDISSLNKPVITNCCYFGETVIPEIYIHNNGVALVEGKDYKLTLRNNDSVGTATAIIEGIGNYNGKQETTFQIKEPAIGDVNMDGNIDVNDVSTIMAYNVELIDLSDSQLALADVNGDGCVDVLDVTLLQKYIAQYVSSLSR